MTREAFLQRARALSSFAEWESTQRPIPLSPSQRVDRVGELYAILPVVARSRAVDPSGVLRMHEALSVLDRSE